MLGSSNTSILSKRSLCSAPCKQTNTQIRHILCKLSFGKLILPIATHTDTHKRQLQKHRTEKRNLGWESLACEFPACTWMGEKCDSEHYLRLQTEMSRHECERHVAWSACRTCTLHKAADNKNDNVIVWIQINVFPKHIYLAPSHHSNIFHTTKPQMIQIVQ